MSKGRRMQNARDTTPQAEKTARTSEEQGQELPDAKSGRKKRKTPEAEEAAFTAEERALLSEVSQPLLLWYDKAKRDLPWRQEITPYRTWLSEIMLQQTRVEAGKDYFLRFVRALPDVEALANAPDELLMKLWEGLGYYSRARNLKKAAGVVMERYSGKIPSDYEELLGLPGIGSYTAGAISSIAFQKPNPAVDGNVLRVVMRLLARRDDIAKDSVKKTVERELRQMMARGEANRRPGDFNQGLMELGATVCIPNGQPRCQDCPWKEACRARALGIAGELPVKQAKKKRRIEKKTVFLLWDEAGRLLLHRRDAKGLLAGMWELPSLSGHLSPVQAQQALQTPCTGSMGENSGPWEELHIQIMEPKASAAEPVQLSFGIEAIQQTTAERAQQAAVGEETLLRFAGSATHIFSHVEWDMIAYEACVQLSGAKPLPDAGLLADAGGVSGGRSLPGGTSLESLKGASVVAEEARPYLRDVRQEPERWIRASREQIRDSLALPSAFKGFRQRILGDGK